jgi:hypothetical protein
LTQEAEKYHENHKNKLHDAAVAKGFLKLVCPTFAEPVKIPSTIVQYDSADYVCNDDDDSLGPHRKALLQPEETIIPLIAPYPQRREIDKSQISWTIRFQEYEPVHFTAFKVYKNQRIYGKSNTAETFYLSKFDDFQTRWKNWIGGYHDLFNMFQSIPNLLLPRSLKTPYNPCGRTGIAGRGSLGRWGQNPAFDLVVTRKSPIKDTYEIIMIGSPLKSVRVPGGFEEGRLKSLSAQTKYAVELLELIKLGSELIYKGYSDDSRNTDNAWIVTNAYWSHIENPKLSYEATQAVHARFSLLFEVIRFVPNQEGWENDPENDYILTKKLQHAKVSSVNELKNNFSDSSLAELQLLDDRNPMKRLRLLNLILADYCKNDPSTDLQPKLTAKEYIESFFYHNQSLNCPKEAKSGLCWRDLIEINALDSSYFQASHKTYLKIVHRRLLRAKTFPDYKFATKKRLAVWDARTTKV